MNANEPNKIPVVTELDGDGNPIIPGDGESAAVDIVEYGGSHIDPEEGTMIISNRLDFKVDGVNYQLSTDGYMTKDQVLSYDPHGELPNILKPYASAIYKFIHDHCAMHKLIAYRQFIFNSDDSFKTFIMVDTNPLNPNVRPYDSISMLAAYLGTYPEDWKAFTKHIMDGDIFSDMIWEVRQKRNGGYRKVYEYYRNLLFLCDEKNYDADDFNPTHFERTCKSFYVNHHDLHDALHCNDETECCDNDWANEIIEVNDNRLTASQTQENKSI